MSGIRFSIDMVPLTGNAQNYPAQGISPYREVTVFLPAIKSM
jgi:hypothetical protein